MNNDMETLIKVIVPVVLLVFWLLSSLFNRENTTKARDAAATPAPRPANMAPQARPIERRPAPAQTNWTSSQKDDVIVIRAEPNRPGTKPNPQQGRRNQNRGRQPNPQQARKAEPTSASRNRELTGGTLVADVNQSLTRSLEMQALSDSMATEATPEAATSSRTTGAPPVTGLDIRNSLTDPTKVRDAFILNEVLGPPVSRRQSGGRR